MNTQQNLLIIDADPKKCQEIGDAMMDDTYRILTANSYEEAMNVFTSEDVTKIILGTSAAGEQSYHFVQQVSEQSSGKNALICHLTDSDNGYCNFPSASSELTQFAISRSSDISHLKEKFQSVDFSSRPAAEKDHVENLMNEVFGTLKSYTAEIYSSLRYASKIQKALLPSEESLQRLMDASVFNSPKNIVSGDFFWYSVRYGRIILAVADCTGHGIPGALLSIIGHDMLNNIVNEKNISEPALILKQLNQGVQSLFEKGENGSTSIKDGMDIAVISIDPHTRTIEFAGAHRPLIGFINGEIVKFKGDLHSIGSHSPVSADFKQHRIQYGLNDTFYLGSDGLCDQFGGPHDKKIGTKQYEMFLAEIQTLSLREQKVRLAKFFSDWKKHHEQTDDVLIVGFRPSSVV